MKKITLITVIITSCLTACHNEEKTDESKPYQTSDTTRTNQVNSQADSAH